MKRFFLSGIVILLLSCPALSKELYVSDTLKTSLRIAPGFNSKVLRMVQSGSKITVLETQAEWSRVKLADGAEGFMMTQALSEEPPKNAQLKSLQIKHQELLKQFEAMKLDYDATKKMNESLKTSLAATGKGGPELEREYGRLKGNSDRYLKIKDEYAKMQEIIEQKDQELDRLNDVVAQKHIYWFLGGAGVLLMGILLGYSLKKKRRHSFLD